MGHVCSFSVAVVVFANSVNSEEQFVSSFLLFNYYTGIIIHQFYNRLHNI